jgi:hypothetical protein
MLSVALLDTGTDYQRHLRLIQTTELTCLSATDSMALSATLSPTVVQPNQPVGVINQQAYPTARLECSSNTVY